MGLIDFRGKVIEAFIHHGWTYHGEITVWTDPQIEATDGRIKTVQGK